MTAPPEDVALLAFFRVIASGDSDRIGRLVAASDTPIAVESIRVGATRGDPLTYRLDSIGHYVYAGDTALHVAAAAYDVHTAQLLIEHGGLVRARNRRGAEPLHYAADGAPDGPRWNPQGQRDVIRSLVGAGADPNARDASGVAPLHRAVRTRCSGAVQALLDNGADPKLMNGRGSTPLHLAVQNTGRGGSGSASAIREQREIIKLLLLQGAKGSDTDAGGKTVELVGDRRLDPRAACLRRRAQAPRGRDESQAIVPMRKGLSPLVGPSGGCDDGLGCTVVSARLCAE